MSMEKLLMLGSCKASEELFVEAKKRGFYTILADNCEFKDSKFKVHADERWLVDTSMLDVLEKKCIESGVTAIINGISTFNIGMTMELCRRLSLPCYCSPEAWHYTIDKLAFKKLCIDNMVPVAKPYTLSNPPTQQELDSIEFPVVVKAVDQSANRGMSYCNSIDELCPAIEYAKSVSKSTEVVVERKLEGIEYGAHYAIADGKATMYGFASMLSQPGEPGNCYSLTSTVADNLQKFLEEVDPFFKKALSAGNMNEGVAWIEMILDKDGHFYVLEMGYRLSGDMIAIPLKDVTGFDSYNWLLDISAGKQHCAHDLPSDQITKYSKQGVSYILWSNDTSGVVGAIEGIELIKSIPNLEIIFDVKEGVKYRSNQYLVTFVFSTDTIDEMIEVISFINRNVKIFDDSGKNICIYYNDFETIKRIYNQQ